MQVVIREKNRYGYFLVSLILFVGGLVMLFGIKGGEFLPTMGRLAGFLSAVVGVVYFSRFMRLSLPQTHTIAIEDHIVRYDKTPHAFATLTFSKEQLEDSCLVSLWAKKGDKQEEIFKKVPFSHEEFEQFIKLIQPYLAHEELPQKITEEEDRIILFDNGFAVDGKEFLYDELQSIETVVVFGDSTENLKMNLILKNGTWDLFFFDRLSEMAKALYADMKFHHKSIMIPCDEPRSYKWLWYVLPIAIALFIADVAYLRTGIAFFIGILFFGFAWYISRLDRKLFYSKLCQELERVIRHQEVEKEAQKLYEERNASKL